MLHRAATTAYSWWWASHIRTKQSKWLEQNLVDMEDRVQGMMKIIDHEGDSFAKRAEMYYKKRPELVEFVEETYRAYRALAERYDHLSKDLQSANRTIAAVFPEQIQMSMESDDENSSHGSVAPSPDMPFKPVTAPKNLPKAPKFPKLPPQSLKGESIISSRKEQLRRSNSNVASVVSAHTSGLTKDEAMKEIDVLQKDILALQTEKEFLKSSYETGLAKFCEIEGKITDMQVTVYNLQDEFGIGTVIEDHEARSLMAATALTSCTEALNKLQAEQDRSMEEVKAEYARIKEAHEKLEALKHQVLPGHGSQQEQEEKEQEKLKSFDLISGNVELEEGLSTDALKHQGLQGHGSQQEQVAKQQEKPKSFDLISGNVKLEEGLSTDALRQKKNFDLISGNFELEEGLSTDALRQKIREKLNIDCSEALTEPELADKIDDLVERIVVFETTIFTQNGMVKRLRQYIDELLQHIRNLEENKESIAQNEEKGKKIIELEEELRKVKSLNQDLVEQKNHLNAELTEANCNLDHLKEKLEDVKPAEEVEESGLFKEAKDEQEAEPEPEPEPEPEKETHDKEIGLTSHDHSPNKREDEEEKQKLQGGESVTLDMEVLEDKDGLNCRKLYMNNIEERERVLVEEYSVILRDYKDIKIKLSEAEKKNREHIFELATHARELRSTIVSKDEEIQVLLRKLEALQGAPKENVDHELEDLSTPKENVDLDLEDFSTPKEGNQHQPDSPRRSTEIDSDRKPLFHHLYDPRTGLIPRSISVSESSTKNTDPVIEESPHPTSRIQGRLRAELNDLLEGNLDFWLRFSTSFHQIQKFQTTIKDLQAELKQLRDSKNQEEGSHNKYNLQTLQSEARPLYKHLREIQTEMTLWLEHNTVFQDELESRFSSLNNIQEEIERVLHAGKQSGRSEISEFQAAKFQGEVLNMKQENSKVEHELQAGVHRVKELKSETEKALVKLDRDFKLAVHKRSYSGIIKSPMSKPRIPLHTFLFGMKLKKSKQKQPSTII